MFSIQGVNYIIPLVTIPYLVRVLGLEVYGKYSIILSVLQYLVIITDYGFNLSGSRQIALSLNDKKKISKIFCAIIICKVIIAAISFFSVFLFMEYNGSYSAYVELFISGMGIVIGTSFFPVWLFQGYERMYWIAISNLFAKITGGILIFLLVHNNSDLNIAIIIQSCTCLISAGIALTTARIGKFVYFLWPPLSEIKKQLKLGWNIFLSTFFSSMYTTSIPLILGVNAGAEAVGVYNSADKLKQALQGIIGPVSQAIYPRSSRLFSHSIKDGLSFVTKVSIFLCSFMFLSSAVGFFLSEYIVNLAFGAGHESSVSVLKIIIWIPSVVAVANMLGVQIILPMGLTKIFGMTYVVLGGIGLIIMYAASYYESFIGVSYAAILIEIIITVIFLAVIKKRIRGKE